MELNTIKVYKRGLALWSSKLTKSEDGKVGKFIMSIEIHKDDGQVYQQWYPASFFWGAIFKTLVRQIQYWLIEKLYGTEGLFDYWSKTSEQTKEAIENADKAFPPKESK